MTNVGLICKCCGDSFITPLKRYNYLLKKNGTNFYCSKECFQVARSPKPLEKICEFCKTEFSSSTRYWSPKCCSRKCAARLSQSFVNVEDISIAMKKALKTKVVIYKKRTCPVCKVIFEKQNTRCCSKKCANKRMSEGGRESAEHQKTTRSSKNEIMFSNLCKSLFTNVLTNERIFNGWDADVILQNEKIAVLWNGNWHRKKITEKHSVSQVQNRDKIKLDEIKKMGYTPYIIEDNGRENSLFVNSEFDKFKLFIDNRRVV